METLFAFMDGLPFSLGSWIANRAYCLNNVWCNYTEDGKPLCDDSLVCDTIALLVA